MPGASEQTRLPKGDPATAPHRAIAPRPLPYHLGAATAIWSSSLAALPHWKNGSIPWPPELAPRAEALRAALAAASTDAFAEALGRELLPEEGVWLDDLALDFAAGAFSYRDMVKRIVTSDTFRRVR